MCYAAMASHSASADTTVATTSPRRVKVSSSAAGGRAPHVSFIDVIDALSVLDSEVSDYRPCQPFVIEFRFPHLPGSLLDQVYAEVAR